MADPLRGMYTACVSLQARHLDALRSGDGRGLSTREMAEHLERESGLRDLYEALEAVLTPGMPDDLAIKAWKALAKARGEQPNAK